MLLWLSSIALARTTASLVKERRAGHLALREASSFTALAASKCGAHQKEMHGDDEGLTLEGVSAWLRFFIGHAVW